MVQTNIFTHKAIISLLCTFLNNIYRPNLSNGVHIIEAISHDYLFPVLIVDKRVESSLKMKWLNPLDRKFIKTVGEAYLSPI